MLGAQNFRPAIVTGGPGTDDDDDRRRRRPTDRPTTTDHHHHHHDRTHTPPALTMGLVAARLALPRIVTLGPGMDG